MIGRFALLSAAPAGEPSGTAETVMATAKMNICAAFSPHMSPSKNNKNGRETNHNAYPSSSDAAAADPSLLRCARESQSCPIRSGSS